MEVQTQQQGGSMGHVLLTLYAFIFGMIGWLSVQPVLQAVFLILGIVGALCNVALMLPKIKRAYRNKDN
jgi:hypothetical protein